MLAFGLKGTIFFVGLGTLMTIIMAVQLPGLIKVTDEHLEEHNEKAAQGEIQKDNWSAFTKVSFAMLCRCIISSCMITFLPLFWVNVLSKSMTQGNMMLTINSIAGAFATLLGGRLADRYGFRKIVMICTIAAPPFFFLFAFNRSSLAGTFLVIGMSMLLSGCQSTFVVLGQSFLPNRIGFASGVMYGLTVSVGGMVAPGIGWIGDNYGLPTSILTLAFISVAGMIFSIMIPRTPLDKPKK
jgi:FSR family fosmidomycin resistance protein-like MFS transporter